MKYGGGSAALDKTARTRKLTVPSYSLSPLHTYAISCHGWMEANEELRNTASGTISVGVSDVTAGLLGCGATGDCRRRVGLEGGLFQLDASSSSDPDMRLQATSQFSYTWTCVPVLGGTERDDLPCASNPQFDSTLSANNFRVQLDPVDLDSTIQELQVSQYKFTVMITSSLYGMIRQSQRSIVIVVEPGVPPPSVEISRVVALKSDTDSKANPSTQIMYRCSSSINVTDPDVDAEYVWTASGPNIAEDVSTFVSATGTDSVMQLPPNTLTAGASYTFQCRATKFVRGVPVADNSHEISCLVNAPPSSGSIAVLFGHADDDAAIGTEMVDGALENKVTIALSNFVDDPADVPNGFEYRYQFLLGCHHVSGEDELRNSGQSPKMINAGVFDNRFKAALPPAMKAYNSSFTLVVAIVDQLGALAIRSKCVEYADFVIDSAVAAGMADELLGEDGAAGLAKATGDTDGQMMAFVSTAAAMCAANPECDSYLPKMAGARRRLQ
eukprot:SAG22_NODE_3819_length_1516_cov_1.657022_1_plen_498_part_10